EHPSHHPILRAAGGVWCRNTNAPFLSIAEAIHQQLLLAAIDLDHCAINKMRQIGGEVSDETGDLLAFGNAPQRYAARRERISLPAVVSHSPRHRKNSPPPPRGRRRRGITRHKADIVPAVLRSERKCQVLSGGICGTWRDFPVGRFHTVITD